DFRFAVEVKATETDARIGRHGQESHRDFVAAVQADTRKTDGFAECLLLEHGADLTGRLPAWQAWEKMKCPVGRILNSTTNPARRLHPLPIEGRGKSRIRRHSIFQRALRRAPN